MTATAPTPEHAWPIRRRVRRNAKKSFHVRRGCGVGVEPATGGDDADVAVRVMIRFRIVCGFEMGVDRDCCSLFGRVHVEKEDVVAERGARIAGG